MTTRAWRWLLASIIGGNYLCHLLGWATICETLRETFHFEDPRGRATGAVTAGGILAWFLPHLFNPAKRPTR